MVNRFVIVAIIIGSITLIFNFVTGFSQIMYFITATSFVIAIIKYSSDKSKEKRKQKDIVELSIKPAVSPIVTVLKTSKLGDFLPEQIDEIEKSAESDVHEKDDLVPTIIKISSKFAEMLKIDQQYRRAYSLALAYRLVFEKGIGEGQAAKEINIAITKRNTIKSGTEYWHLSKEEVDLYLKFSEHEDLLLPFEQIFHSTENVDVVEAKRDREEIYDQLGTVQQYLKGNDIRFQRLLALVLQRIPIFDFLKIISNLRTDIIVISVQGIRDPSSTKGIPAPTGSKYVHQVLQERKLDYGKLNRSVYFTFFSDVIPSDTDPRYFDLQSWGKQIENRANELRQQDNGLRTKFNFIILKSSLHELRSFGDKIDDTSRIKISPEMLTHIGSSDANASILFTISKIIRQNQYISLHDFINRNLECVNGINDESIANRISKGLEIKFDKKEWLISDFKKYSVKKEHLTELGIMEEQASTIINEASSINEIFVAT